MQLAKGFQDIYFPNHLEVDLAGSINMVYYYQFQRKLQPQKPLEHTQWPSPSSTPKCFRNSKSSNCCWNRPFSGTFVLGWNCPNINGSIVCSKRNLPKVRTKGNFNLKKRECMLQRPVGKILDLFKVWTTLSSRFSVYLHPRWIFIGLQARQYAEKTPRNPPFFHCRRDHAIRNPAEISVVPIPWIRRLRDNHWSPFASRPIYTDDALANQVIFSHLRKWERKQTKGNIKPYKPQVAPGVVSMILPLYILLVTLRSAACSVCIKVLNCGWTKHNKTTF